MDTGRGTSHTGACWGVGGWGGTTLGEVANKYQGDRFSFGFWIVTVSSQASYYESPLNLQQPYTMVQSKRVSIITPPEA